MSPADDHRDSTLPGREGVGLSEVAERMAKATQRLQDQVDQARARKARQGKPRGTSTGKPGFYSYVAGEEEGDFSTPTLTLEYPTQGKLSPKAGRTTTGIYHNWEPAEPLYVAIIVGPDELSSGLLRSQFMVSRKQPHEAMLYRWQGSFTLDLIGFDAIDHQADRHSGRVDVLLMTDRCCGVSLQGDVPRDLERAVLEARFKFPEAFLVGLSQDITLGDLQGHPFNSITEKARSRNVQIFDYRLIGDVGEQQITDLLVVFGKSIKYTPQRSVWYQSPKSTVPIPIAKEDIDD